MDYPCEFCGFGGVVKLIERDTAKGRRQDYSSGMLSVVFIFLPLVRQSGTGRTSPVVKEKL